jgi:GNAT superfamily N-acetyltransferase
VHDPVPTVCRHNAGVIVRHDSFELDDDPLRVDRDAVWRYLSTEAYWGRWRTREQVERQVDGAWRVVGAYDAAGGTVGFGRAVSDGVGFAYLADVYVERAVRGRGLGVALVRFMVDEGPGHGFRWALHTRDAHGLYARFGFAEPDASYRERRGANPATLPPP